MKRFGAVRLEVGSLNHLNLLAPERKGPTVQGLATSLPKLTQHVRSACSGDAPRCGFEALKWQGHENPRSPDCLGPWVLNQSLEAILGFRV